MLKYTTQARAHNVWCRFSLRSQIDSHRSEQSQNDFLFQRNICTHMASKRQIDMQIQLKHRSSIELSINLGKWIYLGIYSILVLFINIHICNTLIKFKFMPLKIVKRQIKCVLLIVWLCSMMANRGQSGEARKIGSNVTSVIKITTLRVLSTQQLAFVLLPTWSW